MYEHGVSNKKNNNNLGWEFDLLTSACWDLDYSAQVAINEPIMKFCLLSCITQSQEGQSGCKKNIQCLVMIEHERDLIVTVRFSCHQKALTGLFYRSKLDKVVVNFVSLLIITKRALRSRRLINIIIVFLISFSQL